MGKLTLKTVQPSGLILQARIHKNEGSSEKVSKNSSNFEKKLDFSGYNENWVRVRNSESTFATPAGIAE